MSRLKTQTLILTTSINAVKQWQRELLDKTSLTEEDIGEYTGESKELKPITVTTYNILVYRKKKEEDFLHFKDNLPFYFQVRLGKRKPRQGVEAFINFCIGIHKTGDTPFDPNPGCFFGNAVQIAEIIPNIAIIRAGFE